MNINALNSRTEGGVTFIFILSIITLMSHVKGDSKASIIDESPVNADQPRKKAFEDKQHPFLEGDWNCSACKQHNFARRKYCGRCGGVKNDTRVRKQSKTVVIEKKKKPKHLKRKLEAATDSGDKEAIRKLNEEKQQLIDIKINNCSKWKQVCMSMVQKQDGIIWDDEREKMFNDMIEKKSNDRGLGLSKDKFLMKLGVTLKDKTKDKQKE
jgi:hypothetical protein